MRFGAKTHTGLIRAVNEDSYNIISGSNDTPFIFIIADGMGGHNAGELASKMAVDSVGRYMADFCAGLSPESDCLSLIKMAMEKANEEIFEKAKEQNETYGMGTTLITGMIYGGRFHIGHVGDSRLYLVRGGEISRLTTDHSLIEELVQRGSLTRSEAKNHPQKNVITRALGYFEKVDIDTFSFDIEKNDIYILCTDGLTNMLDDVQIKEVVENTEDPEQACEKLIGLANNNGGNDNITVIVVRT